MKKDNSGECKQDILNRLRRIEGQIKGIQRMVEEDKDCGDVLTQVAAVRAAVNKVGGMVLKGYSKRCMEAVTLAEDKEKVLKDLLETVDKFLKFID